MALTALQRSICRLLAPLRKAQESYVAGGVALNTALQARRRSRDIDLFHDTIEALAATLAADRALLASAGYGLRFLREAPGFTEALVSCADDETLIQWSHDSAYRFFPLLEDRELGLVLHPFDLATNKVLAMAGRLEPRDWVDLMCCHQSLQPLGYLVWAACAKDPGFNPTSLLQEVRRASRYSQAELDILDFDGSPPDASVLGREWHEMLAQARFICQVLPAPQVGTCVLEFDGGLCRLGVDALRAAVETGQVHYHRGRIGGAWPSFPAS
ncbi:MAG: hypothetical protein JXR77_09830 [Lentisphaeria bacterium]|nr:hypothetical protein [Lentisphaeria bacterium]